MVDLNRMGLSRSGGPVGANYGGGGGIPTPNLITAFSLGTTNNNLDWTIGFGFGVTGSVTVEWLYRAKLAGNTGTHSIYLVSRTPGFAILDSVSVNLSTDPVVSMGGLDWCGAQLSSPVALSNGEHYCIMSAEANAGDVWYSQGDTTITTMFSGTAAEGSIFDTVDPPDSVSFVDFGSMTYGPVNALVS